MALAAELDVTEAEAGWAVIRLWSWTMRYAARGRLADGARTALGRLAPVRVEPDRFVRGLISAGWLDDLGTEGWEVHDWADHNGAAVAKAEKDAERKKAARARRGDGAETARAGRADGAGNGTERNGTERRGEGASPAPLQLEAPALNPPRPKAAPNPAAEFERFLGALTPDESAVFDAYEVAFGVRVAADWGLKAFVAKKLKTHTAGELVAAIRGAAKDRWHIEKGSTLRALLSDATKVAQLAKRGAA